MLAEVLIMHFTGAIVMMFIKVTIGLGDIWSTCCPAKVVSFLGNDLLRQRQSLSPFTIHQRQLLK